MAKWFSSDPPVAKLRNETLLNLTPPKGEPPATEAERPAGFYGKWPPDAVVKVDDVEAARNHITQERDNNEAYLAAYEAEIAAKKLVKDAEEAIVTLDTEYRAKLKDARAKVKEQQDREQTAREERRVAHAKLLQTLGATLVDGQITKYSDPGRAALERK